ncbi:MAG: type I DNA topoisomerase [Hyphomicrobiaceae bacterium]|nr:type I DNA topoisomerase [Hyphomicrobiaceae bacterium]
MNLLIVESPAKAKTINKYLGDGYKVIASYGHVRDLPSKDGSVEPDNDFAMHWAQDDERSKKAMRDIVDAVKGAKKIILATDPDREGEAISWHLLEMLAQRKALKSGVPVERVTFNAITKKDVLDAIANPRKIDGPLVDAYLARRALDYLVGFTLSPVLWRKLPGTRSAGRVQSVALRLVCDREAEIEIFRTDEYWTVDALLKTAKNDDVRARLISIAGQRLEKLTIKDQASASAIKVAVEGCDFHVSSIDKKSAKRNPSPPFTTSTLQMDASRKLGFSAKQTMGTAQRLYEGVDIGGETVGLITYMRTDGVQIGPDAVADIRNVIRAEFGDKYTPIARDYKSKAKNAQEAHEAIRPTDPKRTPDSIRRLIDKDQAALYDLIWKRTIASQMAPAEIDQTTAEIDVKGRDGKAYGFRASGSVVTFDGFRKVYEEGRDARVRVIEKGKDDVEVDAGEDDSRRLPPLAVGDKLAPKQIDADQHFTQPPPRFSEATLVKRMEELGIGRPSTYASTMAVLQDRDYVRMEKKQLIPEDRGRLVTAFLESFFMRYVEYDFTADLEEKLDLISDGKLKWKDVLRDFWRDFTGQVSEIKELRVTQVLDALNELLGPHVFPAKEDGGDPRLCPKCGKGQLSLKISGRNGAFVGCGNYPECTYTRQLSQTGADGDAAAMDGKVLGLDPLSGKEVSLRNGRFGAYVQLGEAELDATLVVEVEETKPKRGKAKPPKPKMIQPKRSSLPKGWDPASMDLERALKLLNLPRLVGEHPETKTPIKAALGRFGPYILHDGTYANVESIEEVFDIGLNRAVIVLVEKRAGGGKGRFQRNKPTVLKELGEHPSEGGKIEILEGKYGAYVSHNGVNATVPKGKEPATVSVEDAVMLISERIAKGGLKPKKGAKKAPSKAAAKTKAGNDSEATAKLAVPKPAIKKPAASKAAAKKAPAKKKAAG